MQKGYIVFIAISLFFCTLFIITTLHNYDTTLESYNRKKHEPTQFKNVYELLAQGEVPAIWKKPEKDQERLKLLNDTERAVREERQFEGSGMTREELGRHGWALLHMISATLPEEFDEEFVFKINVFLNLFGQFYPCKLCAGHFLQHIEKFPYSGKTREDFMQYMCALHNVVNKSLKKPTFECAKVHDVWGGYCGCEEEFKKSVDRYKALDDE